MARTYQPVGIRTCKCQGCGQEFEAKRSDAKWCSSCGVGVAAIQRGRNFETRTRKHCPDCGELCARRAVRCRACDNRQRVGNSAGELNNSWKGGRHQRRDGYVEILVAPYTRRLEHLVVWEQAHGPIPKGYVVHHLNGVKDDNRLENLDCTPRASHGPRLHADPTHYEARIRELEARVRELEGKQIDA